MLAPPCFASLLFGFGGEDLIHIKQSQFYVVDKASPEQGQSAFQVCIIGVILCFVANSHI